MGFYLQKAKAVLEKAISARVGKGESEVELDNGLVLRMSLDNQGTHDAADFFFPGYSVVEDRIAELEGMHPGLSATVKLSPPAMTFVIYDGAGVNKVFQLQGANIKGSVAFKINGKGDGEMKLTVNAKLSRDDMANLHDYVGADVYVSAMDMQADMFASGTPDAQGDLEASVGMTGAELRAGREGAGWTRDEMAKRAGMSPKSIGRYERGERIMTADVVEKIEFVFAGNDVEPGDDDTAPNDDDSAPAEPASDADVDVVYDDEDPAAGMEAPA